jgi:hypothetical protein
MIFFPTVARCRFLTPILPIFALIISYFAFILHFYILFSLFLSPYFIVLSPFSLISFPFPPLSLPLFIFPPPQMTLTDIPRGGEGFFFLIYRPLHKGEERWDAFYVYLFPHVPLYRSYFCSPVQEIFPTRKSTINVFHERKPVLEMFSQVQRVKELVSPIVSYVYTL